MSTAISMIHAVVDRILVFAGFFLDKHLICFMCVDIVALPLNRLICIYKMSSTETIEQSDGFVSVHTQVAGVLFGLMKGWTDTGSSHHSTSYEGLYETQIAKPWVAPLVLFAHASVLCVYYQLTTEDDCSWSASAASSLASATRKKSKTIDRSEIPAFCNPLLLQCFPLFIHSLYLVVHTRDFMQRLFDSTTALPRHILSTLVHSVLTHLNFRQLPGLKVLSECVCALVDYPGISDDVWLWEEDAGVRGLLGHYRDHVPYATSTYMDLLAALVPCPLKSPPREQDDHMVPDETENIEVVFLILGYLQRRIPELCLPPIAGAMQFLPPVLDSSKSPESDVDDTTMDERSHSGLPSPIRTCRYLTVAPVPLEMCILHTLGLEADGFDATRVSGGPKMWCYIPVGEVGSVESILLHNLLGNSAETPLLFSDIVFALAADGSQFQVATEQFPALYDVVNAVPVTNISGYMPEPCFGGREGKAPCTVRWRLPEGVNFNTIKLLWLVFDAATQFVTQTGRELPPQALS